MTTIASTGPAPSAATASPASNMPSDLLKPSDTFIHRHVGPNEDEVAQMLALLGYESLDALTDAVVPESIRLSESLPLGDARGEHELLSELRTIADQNRVMRSCIGMGYSDCITPGVIQRNVLENPGWYTQYTPYQAEIAQGRLEALLNFQTMIADLTGLPAANASLLDEGTAAAEAMAMCHSIARKDTFFIADDCHPQTINVVKTRAASMGIKIQVGDIDTLNAHELPSVGLCGVLVQYPATDGIVHDPDKLARLAAKVHEAGGLFVVAADPLALTLLKAPGEFGADICVGSAQRFGVPMGCGGPHAAFMATHDKHIRKMPGRIVGVSKDAQGNPAYRLAIQTREQHIKREKATSNICTAQVLLAVMASMYAVYHGPDGLKRIARRVNALTGAFAAGVAALGHDAGDQPYFDTLKIGVRSPRGRITPIEAANQVHSAAQSRGYNLRQYGDGALGVSFDETTTIEDVAALLEAFALGNTREIDVASLAAETDNGIEAFQRTSEILTHPVFNQHHSEHEMLRYLRKLESRDLSLTTSMIPLGSCTMKLNGTTEMLPVTWPQFGRIHPFAPAEQLKGYQKLCGDLESWLCAITGFAAVSLQPNAGSQGEYAGLLAIRAYHESRGEGHRTKCLIPVSAHGTNPASAVIAGFEVVTVECDKYGNVNAEDLRKKAGEHAANLACLMITYPSTHGVFEPNVKEIVSIVHEHGGQVYMDGANMNAQVGLTSPASIGADVCHLNLHKTFCIPHGGGGPGMGPIGVAEHLAPFLPGHPLEKETGDRKQVTVGAVSAAPWGSASILPISYVYIALMGAAGLRRATQVAILSANYMAKRLGEHYPVVYTGTTGLVAHEFIIDCRQFEATSGVKIDDIAKRLMDYGFHAPTMSFPVPGTLMIEPTESEPKAELDRLCDALISIRGEIRDIEEGKADRADNALKHAPHTARAVSSDAWDHKYSREQAAYPAAWLKEHKFWPHVGRIDNPYGDRNLFCTCPPVDA